MSDNNNNKTGYDFLDRLSKKEQIELKRKYQAHLDSLTPEQRVESLNLHYQSIRKKMKSKGGLITQEQALKEIINVDAPRIIEEIAADFEQGGYFHIANKLRAKRFGVDYLYLDELFELIPPDTINIFVGQGDEKYSLGPVVEKKDKEGRWREDSQK